MRVHVYICNTILAIFSGCRIATSNGYLVGNFILLCYFCLRVLKSADSVSQEHYLSSDKSCKLSLVAMASLLWLNYKAVDLQELSTFMKNPSVSRSKTLPSFNLQDTRALFCIDLKGENKVKFECMQQTCTYAF